MSPSNLLKMNDLESYKNLLNILKGSNPILSNFLITAQKNRQENILHYLGGTSLKGLDNLLSYLAESEKAFHENEHLSKYHYFLVRIKGDFEIAIEAFLSGLHPSIFDVMRDAMEVEFLLRDFLIWPSHFDEWLENDGKNNKKFQPASLRRRFSDYCGHCDIQGTLDYKIHSQLLHVTPKISDIRGLTINSDNDVASKSICLWEIMQHAMKIVLLIHRYQFSIPIKTPVNFKDLIGLENFYFSWEKCLSRYRMWESILKMATNTTPNSV